jgi:hypothetical protein
MNAGIMESFRPCGAQFIIITEVLTMSYVHPQGKISFTASTSADVVGYRLFQVNEGEVLSYSSPFADIGNVTEVVLPIPGLPAAEGSIVFGIAAMDQAGNLSDITPVAPVLIDVTPPAAPTDPVYSRDF